jgi:selenocysteine lyase/cysteine desulfurase
VESFGSDPSTRWAQMAEHEARLQQILPEFLASGSRITIIGEPSARKELRVPVISFVVRSAFGFRSCPMYSHRLLAEVCGLPDVEDGVRVSLLHYNTGEWPVSIFVRLC